VWASRVLAQPGRASFLCNQAAMGCATLLQQAMPSTMQAVRPLKPARGLCFIFLFSEYNQINANSKICTSFI
jgi:hypothetical protein